MKTTVFSCKRDSDVYHESEGLVSVPLSSGDQINVEEMREKGQYAFIQSTWMPMFGYLYIPERTMVDAIIRSCMCDQPADHLTEVVILDINDHRNATLITMDTR